MQADSQAGATWLSDFVIREAIPAGNLAGLDRLAGSSLLITGASGLIGTWMLASLPEAPHEKPNAVVAVTRGRPTPCFQALARRKGVRILTGDLADPAFRQSLPEADAVVHAAGYGQPGKFLADPVTTMALNVCATIDLFRKLRPGGRFLYLSTSEIYSGLPPGKHSENQTGTTNTDHPRACYIEGKRAGEVLCHAHAAMGVKAHAARLALAYGPGIRLDDARVLNVFILRALSGAVSMADRGLALRTYCYAADAVEILWRILLDGTRVVYNVGGISQTSIAGLAEAIAGIVGVPVIMPEEDSFLRDAPGEVSLDLSHLEQDFGKTDFIGLDTGLERTVEWLQALKASEENKS